MSRAEVLLREKWALNIEAPWREIAEPWIEELGVPRWRVAQRMGVSERRFGAWLRGENEPKIGTVLAILRTLAEIQAEQEADSSKARERSHPVDRTPAPILLAA